LSWEGGWDITSKRNENARKGREKDGKSRSTRRWGGILCGKVKGEKGNKSPSKKGKKNILLGHLGEGGGGE